MGVTFAPLPAQDKPIELRFSSWVATVHGHHTGVMVPWAKMVEDKSGGRLKITIYPGSTLGKAVDHYDMVKDGIADMGFTVPGYTPGRFQLITALELPGLFKTSRGGSLAVMSVFDKYFKSEFKDVKILWFWVHPPGHFHLAKKQVKVLEDLNGLKIRAATPMLTNMVKTLGAIPVSIPAPDTYTALERGTVDGTIFPWEAISSFKIAEVLKYHVASGLYVAPLFTLMNQKKYDSLPPDLRKVIDDLSGSFGRRVHRHESGTRTSSSASRRSRRRAGHLHPAPRGAPALGRQAQADRGGMAEEHGGQGAPRPPAPQRSARGRQAVRPLGPCTGGWTAANGC